MILKADRIADLLREGRSGESDDPLVFAPAPDVDQLRQSGAASIDLRLGTWFVTLRRARMKYLDIDRTVPNAQLTKTRYVPFGQSYILHPRSFVLSVTLEWMRIPSKYAGYVVGKSGWGRRGLIIATATGVHPGFTGCLTLELTNVGEIPIAINPGMRICQLFLHQTEKTGRSDVDSSQFIGMRKPTIGRIAPDEFASKLAGTSSLQ